MSFQMAQDFLLDGMRHGVIKNLVQATGWRKSMGKISLPGYNDEELLKILEEKGCVVERGPIVTIIPPAPPAFAYEWCCPTGLYSSCNVYCFVFRLKENARLIHRHKISGTISQRKSSGELFLFLNESIYS
jgi:hypothetical protein